MGGAGSRSDQTELGNKRLSGSWGDLASRAFWGAFLGGGFLAGAIMGGPAFAGLTAALTLLTLIEWYDMTMTRRHWVQFGVAVMVADVCTSWGLADRPSLPVVFALLFVGAVMGGWLSKSIWPAIGTIYCAFVLMAMLALRSDAAYGLAAILFVAISVWGTDSFAYLVGRWIGGPPLSPTISPNKTWSGAIGGTVGGTVCGVVLLMAFGLGGGAIHVVLACFLSVAAQAGDLGESWVKRRFRVKDSSQLIPGHGGLLDRIDALMTAMILALGIGVLRGGFDAPAAGLIVW